MKKFSFGTAILLLLSAFTLSGTVFATSVTSVNKAKGAVTIDSGEGDGFKKGDKICFYDDDGKKTGCGKVAKIKANAAIVKVNKKVAGKVSEGMSAELSGKKGKKKGGSGSLTKIKLNYVLTPITPAKYNKLAYLYPDATPPETIWNPAETSSKALFGFGAELAIGNLSLGGRIRNYQQYQSLADYTSPASDKYVEVSQAASALGFYVDYYFLEFGLFKLGAGVDADLSTMNLAAAYKTDAGDEAQIADASTKLTTISARFPFTADVYLDPVGINLSAVFVLPLAGTATGTANVYDTNGNAMPDDPTSDLLLSINHSKNTFGLELVFGAYFAF